MVSVSLPRALWQAVDAEAKRRGLTRSGLVGHAVSTIIDRRTDGKKDGNGNA